MSETVAGSVNIANDVLADIAGYACLESYGVVGMASPSLRDGVAQLLPAAKLRKGVKVATADDGVSVDLYVIVEFGTNLDRGLAQPGQPRPLRAHEHGRRQGRGSRSPRAGRQSAQRAVTRS